MNENNYRITPLPVLSNVSRLNSTKENEGRKKRQKQKKRSTENPDLIELESNEFQDTASNKASENEGDEQQIDFCA